MLQISFLTCTTLAACMPIDMRIPTMLHLASIDLIGGNHVGRNSQPAQLSFVAARLVNPF
jgi:hypothetical protein